MERCDSVEETKLPSALNELRAEVGQLTEWSPSRAEAGKPPRKLRPPALILASGVESIGGWHDDEDLDFLFLREPPSTGTSRRAPPLVQYLRQLLQKWRGWARL